MKIGIIGNGFVGNAVAQFYKKNNYNVVIFDKENNKSEFGTLNNFLNSNPEYIFICVPTPQIDGYDKDFEIVGDICKSIEKYSIENDKIFKIIIKSTTSPDYLKSLELDVKKSILITSPEFLSQKTAVEDFENSKILLFGCNNIEILDDIKNKLCNNFPNLEDVQLMNDIYLPMRFKYAHNVMGAISVLMSNIMYDYIDNNNNYQYFKKFLTLTEHFTDTYLNVPRHDGKRGFGGACFPKDINSFIQQIKNIDNNKLMKFNFIKLAQLLNNSLRDDL